MPKVPKNEVWPIKKLQNWEDNPRKISDKELGRLKRQIKKLGAYKPLIVTEDGTVLGGNMRLRALREMGETEVWVSIVDAPTHEQKVEYALSDNDIHGITDRSQMAELLKKHAIEMDLFRANLSSGNTMKAILNQAAQDKLDGEEHFAVELSEQHNYLVLYFDNPIDWQTAVEFFGVKAVKAHDWKPGYERKGIGRVIDGAKAIKKLKVKS